MFLLARPRNYLVAISTAHADVVFHSGTVKSISAEAIRLLLSVLGFMTFGYGSREFEVTAERLGCYRPEDHIDNPKGVSISRPPSTNLQELFTKSDRSMAKDRTPGSTTVAFVVRSTSGLNWLSTQRPG